MQSTTEKKKVKKIFTTKKGSITCSKLMIKLAGSLTRSENVYFANNEQASIAVFTAVFCFTRTEHNLIKLKLYNNQHKLLTVCRSVLCEVQRNQSNFLTFKNQPINHC